MQTLATCLLILCQVVLLFCISLLSPGSRFPPLSLHIFMHQDHYFFLQDMVFLRCHVDQIFLHLIVGDLRDADRNILKFICTIVR